VPVGYACPPGGSTEGVLKTIGRHGNRPAHIHFFVSAHGYRHLTTQINIEGDPYLHDDFAYATRDELIPPINHVGDSNLGANYGVDGAFAEIKFDFTMHKAADEAEEEASTRLRAAARGQDGTRSATMDEDPILADCDMVIARWRRPHRRRSTIQHPAASCRPPGTALLKERNKAYAQQDV
jgi:hypothetical protein